MAYYTTRAFEAAMNYPGLRPRDIGLYQAVYRNTKTGQVFASTIWRPHAASNCHARPPGKDWVCVEMSTWVFPPLLTDL